MKRKLLELFGGDDMKKLLAALDGHKTELGLVIAALPDIANAFVAFLNSLLPIFAAYHMDAASAAIVHASGLILAGVGGIHRVWKILSALLKDEPKDPKPPSTASADLRAGALAGAMALALIASPAMAQEPASSPSNTLKLSSGATRFFSPGIGDTTEIEGQIALEVHAPSAFVIEGFGRFTRTQGTEPRQGLLDINTFRSIVAHVALRREVAPHVEALCSSGVSWSRDKVFNPADPNIWAVGCGARGALKGKGSLTVKVGHNGSVGGLGVFGELVINQGTGVRYLATYAIPFDAARFRRNPGTFTGGLQVDLWTRGF